MTVDTKAIEKVITIAARPETVFRLLTDPSEYVRWKGKLAQLEPRAGGTFHVDFMNDKDVVDGKFVEVIPSRRVVFTWGWKDNPIVPPGSSTVEIDLEPDGQGTRLRLVHRGLPEQAIPTHAEGWDYFLPRLTSVAEGRPLDTGDENAAKKQM
ncbi:MAG TPA: SRPBCC domain-containing protein [Gemmatimonadaceae bacterium]|nr:SRPBCC domain-containing protein [Gemmatimonadaceae bacterium]